MGAAVVGTVALPLSASAVSAAEAAPAPSSLDWERRYGDAGRDGANALVSTADGGYAFAGVYDAQSSSGYLNRLPWLVKLDGDGDVEWERVFDDRRGGSADCLAATPDGGLVVGLGEDVIKVDPSGDERWRVELRFPEVTLDIGGFRVTALVRAADGGYVAAGGVDHPEGGVGVVAKIALDGDVVWSTVVDQPNPDSDWPMSTFTGLALAPGGGYAGVGYAAAGLVSDTEFDLRPWLVELTEDGDVEWKRLYSDAYSVAGGVVPRHDGGFVVGGTVSPGAVSGPIERPTPFLLWTDDCGNAVRYRTYAEPFTTLEGLVRTEDGYVFGGQTVQIESGFVFGEWRPQKWGLVGVAPSGDVEWVRSYENDPPTDIGALVRTRSGFGVAGWAVLTPDFDGDTDAWVADVT